MHRSGGGKQLGDPESSMKRKLLMLVCNRWSLVKGIFLYPSEGFGKFRGEIRDE